MKTISCLFSLMAFLAVSMQSCQKIELETDDEKSHPSDELPDQASFYRVSQIGNLSDGSYVYLKAYIVGYASGASKSSFTWGTPQEKAVRSNILLADTLVDLNKAACAPCQLEANTDVRDDLNLVDNPQNVGRKVLLYGKLNTYFGMKGLKPVISYEWVEENSDESPESPSEESTVVNIPVSQVSSDSPFDGC